MSDRCFDEGLLVLGISGSIDGKAGEAVILAPVSAFYSPPDIRMADLAPGLHRDKRTSPRDRQSRLPVHSSGDGAAVIVSVQRHVPSIYA